MACERELETKQKLQYFDLHSYGRQRCVFLVLLMLNRRPRGPLGWVMAFFTASYQQSLWTPTNQGSKAPLAWCGFTYHISSISISNSNWNWDCLTSVLTELYNSSTPTQSPTRSLKSHVWSSSRGNNCHAVHRSLSSGASVYECTMGIFYLVPFHQPISAHVISTHNCHQNVSPPSSASPWNGIFGRVEVQNTTLIPKLLVGGSYYCTINFFVILAANENSLVQQTKKQRLFSFY